ncbi:unnamed protein product [Rangifer tarandus platyrhynchus]|uniref:Uncharacterized protein n=2 Tax=Rangifer tarandus platyrhynchus TaxID=3082113 RepID=A0AC59YAB1_RANTA|nr:unnamed protein product [Rangifer tarandus platyrhynchus]
MEPVSGDNFFFFSLKTTATIWEAPAGARRGNHKPTRMGFEPTRAEHNGLAVHRLNHSATSSWHYEVFPNCSSWQPDQFSSSSMACASSPTGQPAEGAAGPRPRAQGGVGAVGRAGPFPGGPDTAASKVSAGTAPPGADLQPLGLASPKAPSHVAVSGREGRVGEPAG